MKITKETFIAAIENIKKQYEQEKAFSVAVNQYFSEDIDNSLPRNYVVDSLVQILQQHFKDNNAHSWIEFYIWDLNFGSRLEHIEINREPFQLKTPADLYKLLTLK